MDIETIKQLQHNGAAIALMLKEVNIRNRFSEYHLVALFEIMDKLGKHSIPVTLTIATSKSKRLLINKCALAGVSFADFPLADADRPNARRSAGGQCQRSCNLCLKSDFDNASGCHNPAIFSAGVGDWVCNLSTPFEGRLS